ncbi:MAG: endonuclease domain-containing protein, partial [Actinomycetota bacterium]
TKTGRQAYCKPCWNAIVKEHKEKRYGGHSAFMLQLRYGLGTEALRELARKQLGVCAVCREYPVQHVDHDHETEAIRGLLCFTCNNALGKFDDDPALIETAVRYLSVRG